MSEEFPEDESLPEVDPESVTGEDFEHRELAPEERQDLGETIRDILGRK